MSKASLKQELRGSLRDIEVLAVEVGKIAEDIGCSPMQVRNTNGDLMMMPLVIARANVLTALANLEKS